jgi:protein-L-isoaspartate(D-aspartate) O-methyltransferase
MRKGRYVIMALLLAVLFFGVAFQAVAQQPETDVRNIKFPPIDNKQAYLQWMQANTNEDSNFLSQRWDRMQQDLAWYPTSTSDRTIQAFLRTPREFFVREYNSHRAYDHMWLLIEDGQTISGPHIVIRMTETILPDPDHKVLEIGTGSGYQSAFLSYLSNNVYSIEIKSGLYKVTEGIYGEKEKEYKNFLNVTRKNADGYFGWEQYGPFDRIIVTCAIDHIPPALLKQLKPGGIMVIPVGPIAGDQVLLKVTKKIDSNGVITLEREDVYNGRIRVKFVPFTATDGSWHTK